MIAVLISAVVLLTISCANVPSYRPDKPMVTIEKATSTDIRAFGSKMFENPYIEPASLIRGKIDEFFIVKIGFNLPKKSKVSINAVSAKTDGSEAGKFYTATKLMDYWMLKDVYAEDDNPYANARQIAIQRSCIPSLEYMQNEGMHEYFLPLISSNPIPRPATISITITVDDAQSFSFEYQL